VGLRRSLIAQIGSNTFKPDQIDTEIETTT
jgi:hypothetical protein